MKIQMIGLDYKCAELTAREKFVITTEQLRRVLTAYKQIDGVSGLVIISTCNRTEVYLSTEDFCAINAAEFLCEVLGQSYEHNAEYFSKRFGVNALEHLCKVAAGVYSQILGDDQIITQVRESLELSRENHCTDSYLETMFKMAIKAAKTIKTRIILRTVSSAPEKALERLRALTELDAKNVVVIGNGQMGRLASKLLIDAGANVTITLREYKKGVIEIPRGAGTVHYSDRYAAIEKARIVISATASPHYTLYYEDFAKLNTKPEILIDLAVPRDIEPEIKPLVKVLLTMDDLADNDEAISEDKQLLIDEIVAGYIEKYYRWIMYKEAI